MLQVKEENVARAIIKEIETKMITTVCIGKPHLKLWQIILKTGVFSELLTALSENDVDLVILS